MITRDEVARQVAQRFRETMKVTAPELTKEAELIKAAKKKKEKGNDGK